MKITFVLPTADLSGGIRVIAIQAASLAARGHDVVLVSLPPQGPSAKQKLKALIKGQSTETPKQPRSHLDGTSLNHTILDRWRPIADADVPDADVVIATWWETAEWVHRLSPRKGAKAFFVQHHEVFDYLPVERVRATWRLPLHKIAVSSWLAKIAAEEYGDHNVWLATNGVDPAQFHAPARERQQNPTVGLLYSTVYWKGVGDSVAALARVRERLPDLRLRAFGAMRPDASVPLPADCQFTLRPEQDKIRDIYASCDVWLCGSHTEGFCLPLLEAMACRTPVVSTRVGGASDLIVEGRNGFSVPVGAIDAMAVRLLDILGLDNRAWRAVSDAARETASRHTWDRSSADFERALAQIVAGAPAPSLGIGMSS